MIDITIALPTHIDVATIVSTGIKLEVFVSFWLTKVTLVGSKVMTAVCGPLVLDIFIVVVSPVLPSIIESVNLSVFLVATVDVRVSRRKLVKRLVTADVCGPLDETSSTLEDSLVASLVSVEVGAASV